MIKKVRVWYFVLGALFFLPGILGFITESYIVGAIVLTIGIAFIVIGIICACAVNKHNHLLEQQYENVVFVTECPHCNREVHCYINDFKPHGRYPEGFIYCPICKKPISKNAFEEEYED